MLASHSSIQIVDEALRDRASPELAQPSRRMTQSMTQNPGLGQDHPLAVPQNLSYLRE